jgi:hypothetical protein
MQQFGSLLQNLLFAQHFSGTIMPIIRSSRVLDRWLLPVVLGGAVVYVSGHLTYSSTPDQQPVNQSTKYHRQQPPV